MNARAASLSAEFLDLDLLSRLPRLELQAKFLVTGFLAGLHRSPFHGSSVEFKEHRTYRQGDDLRSVDWKVYARTDRLHIRLRDDETNLTATLLLDRSASMEYRSPKALMTKWDYTRSLAAAFLLLLQRQRDATALGFMGEALEEFMPGSTRPSHFHRLMAALHRPAAAATSGIPAALATAADRVRPRSIVLVFSDFYADPAALEPAFKILHHRHCEVICFHILDPMEVDFDFDEPVRLREREDASLLTLTPELIRNDYRRRFEAHRTALAEQVRRLDGDFLPLRTDEAPLAALGAYLARRNARL